MQEQSLVIDIPGTTPILRGQEPSQAVAALGNRGIASLHRVLNVDLELRVELGRVSMPIREILDLSSGAIVDMKKVVGEPMNVFVNDKLLAKGEVVVVDDVLGVRITEIVNQNEAGIF